MNTFTVGSDLPPSPELQIGPTDECIRLFSYETQGGAEGDFWRNPLLFSRVPSGLGHMLDDEFARWARRKRPISKSEVVLGSWLKIPSENSSTSSLVAFKEDGSLQETRLFDDTSVFQGEWRIVGPCLTFKIGDYKLALVANRDGNIHSAVEIGPEDWQVYFKLIHLPRP